RTGDVPAVVHSKCGIYKSGGRIPYNRLIHQSQGARGEPRYVNIGVREVPQGTATLRGVPHEPDDPIRDPAGKNSSIRPAAPIQPVRSRTNSGDAHWMGHLPHRDVYVGR